MICRESLEFYCGILGFEILDKAGPADDIGWALMKLNGVRLMLNTQYEMDDRPPVPDKERIKAHGDTCFILCVLTRMRSMSIIIQNGICGKTKDCSLWNEAIVFFGS